METALYVHRASRTEALAGRLAEQLDAAPPPHPLGAPTVVVAHPGLRRWLFGFLATRGTRGIAANLDTPLPWQWLERTAVRVLGEVGAGFADYRAERLRWRIFHLLPSLATPRLARVLAGDDAERRRFRLASHLASLYAQYLVYRPDWIAAWEQGEYAHDWQATLWRRLRATIAAPHRAERHAELVAALAGRGDGETAPLHVFGVSHLPPDVIGALAALARHRDIHVYFPDPCREHWAYLASRREVLARADAAAQYLEIGHPLLTALGRLGQDFCHALEALEAHDTDVAEDEETPSHLLARVQQSVRELRPERVGEAWAERLRESASRESALAAARADASLRVHVCHTRLRELEVLKDALLGFLADDRELTPRDIVVMAPDIGAYAPLLPAVFGEPARHAADPMLLPWHLADVALARSHPLFGAFARLIELAEGRFRLSEILDFLDLPAVARRFGIDADARAMLARWLARAHVAWGLDAEMKAAVGGAALDANSWQFGFDRLYAGLLVGDELPPPLVDGVLPLPGVAGTETEAIGRLDRLLTALRELRGELARPRLLAEWCERLHAAVDTFLAADPADAREAEALEALHRALATLAEPAAASGASPVAWSALREALRDALAAVAERQPFLLGGITFCGLVPQRAIPFRVVCLLGMNEGEFPRAAADAGLNRMVQRLRRGDRDARREDRYLFLEALMAARDRLHVSYCGEDAHDGHPRDPAAPLAELLRFLDEQHGLAGDDARPWLVRHALQPYAARYYERVPDDASDRGDPRLFSFERAYVAVPAQPAAPEPPFLAPDAGGAAPVEWSLRSLKRFWRDPARATLRDGEGIALDALADDAPPDCEPLAARAERRERVAERLLFEALREGHDELPATPPDELRLSGALPAGAALERLYAAERELAQAALTALRAQLGGAARRADVVVALDLDCGLHLAGVVEGVFRAADGRIWLIGAKPHGTAGLRDLVPFYLDWAALRLTEPKANVCFVEKASNSTMRIPPLIAAMREQDPARLRAGLTRLLAAARDASGQPLLYFPDTAWAWLRAPEAKRLVSARNVWLGGFQAGERDRAPGYAALLMRGRDLFGEDREATARFAAACELVADVLDPERRVLKPDAREETDSA